MHDYLEVVGVCCNLIKTVGIFFPVYEYSRFTLQDIDMNYGRSDNKYFQPQRYLFSSNWQNYTQQNFVYLAKNFFSCILSSNFMRSLFLLYFVSNYTASFLKEN